EKRWVKLLNDYPAAAKYSNDTLYGTKTSWANPWIYNKFTAGVQSTQRIESINMHIYQKVDRATSLYNLLISLNDHISQEEHLMQFEIQHNALPTVGLPMLNVRFFSKVDEILKNYLTPIMLEIK